MRKSLVPEAIEAFIETHLVHQTEIEGRLHQATMTHERVGMCSSPEVGALLALLVQLVRARRVVEIGVFTGYATLKMAGALPHDGKLVACDIEPEFVAIGRPYWDEAGVADRIDLRIGPALDTLAGLESEAYDFAFVDADKAGYPAYYESCLRLLRQGGLMVLDNMLRGGRIADLTDTDEDTRILRQLGVQIANDPRVTAALLTVGDGLMLAHKR